MVYTRKVEGKEINLASSGKLYRDALVLYDPETNREWTQLDGAPLRDKKRNPSLHSVPAVQTTWSAWKKMHPDTLVLKKDPAIDDTLYGRYQSDSRLGLAGTRNPDPRLPGKSLVVTLQEGRSSLAVPLEALKRVIVHQSRLGNRSVAIVLNPGCGTVRVFDRRVGDRLLKFELVRRGQEVALRDRETSTIWSLLTGAALEGSLTGAQLLPVQHGVNYWFAWANYRPGTRVEPAWAVQATPAYPGTRDP